MPLWHCSISLAYPPKPLKTWTEAQLELVRRAVNLTLKGVGDPVYQIEQEGEVALHVRRRMVEAEARELYARRGLTL